MNALIVQRARYALPAVLALLLLASCSSGPSIYTNVDPTATFANYRTYNFMSPLGTDRAGYSSVLSQFLRTAASRELEARGYQKSDNPDLLVNFNVNTKEKIQSTTTSSGPAYGGYYGYRSGYYGTWGGYDTHVTQYTEGTLTVDVVDAGRKQLAWDGTAVGRIREETRKNLQPAVDAVMAQVFEKFPSRNPPAPAP
ncbi:MAG: DUF4136 domain-containing protein [Gammaproteobacteria bacterium]